MVSIFGLITENTKEDGKTINFMERGFTHGQTVVNMMVTTLKTRKVALALIIGQMAECMKATGKMENNTDQANLQIQKV